MIQQASTHTPKTKHSFLERKEHNKLDDTTIAQSLAIHYSDDFDLRPMPITAEAEVIKVNKTVFVNLVLIRKQNRDASVSCCWYK